MMIYGKVNRRSETVGRPARRLAAAVAGVVTIGAWANATSAQPAPPRAEVEIDVDRPTPRAGTGGAAVTSVDPTVAELQAEVRQMRAEMNAMRANQDRVTTGEADAAVADVGRETDRAGAATETPFTAGYDDGFGLRSDDGAFSLDLGFQFQFRSVTNFTDDEDGDEFEDVTDGFEIRRMKVQAEGTAFAEEFFYNFRAAFDRGSGTPSLEYAYIGYELTPEVAFLVGQWKDDVFQEETTSSGRQLAADRSLVNEQLGGGLTDYVQGVQLLYEQADNGPFRAQASYQDGLNTDNTNFNDGGGSAGLTPDFGASARVAYKAFGNYRAYRDFTALGTEEPLLVFSAGGNYSAGGDDSIVLHTADVQYEPNGQLGLFGAYYGSYAEAGEDDGYDYGALGQVAYLLAPDGPWEVFGRYDIIFFDDDGALIGDLEDDTISEITGGVNYYFEGHAAKVTVDVSYLPDGSPGGSGIGHVSGDDDQFIIRGQFQLLL